MYEFLQRVAPFAFPILWFAPTIVLFFRFRKKSVAYLRPFPPIDRYRTLDLYTVIGDPPGTYRRILDVQLRRQGDPELERLRREMWRSYGLVMLWVFGFPLLTFAALTILILTGHPPTSL
jgi:hypothetical protein